MSELLFEARAEATPPDPNWRWHNGLDSARAQHQPRQPTLIATGGVLMTFDTLEQLAAAIGRRLEGRAPVLVKTVATYHGFDTFPAFSVYAAPRAPGDASVGYAAVQDVKPATHQALADAIAAAQQHAEAA